MIWYAAGLAWVLQICFWGLGLTLLVVPARWRRFWPAFCAPAGLALQSLVVWVGTHTLLPGTDSYALAAQLIPAALLGIAWWRERGNFGRLLAGAWRWGAVGALVVVSLSLQAYPFTKPPGLLTSAAIGSCDAADYAAGARVFKEFARHDRSGFMGSTEIARTLSVDNFFDFWLRINHFSPSAIIAFDASLGGRQPYELTSLLGVVLLALHLPSVFWLARSAFRFRPAGALAVAAVYGVSPIMYYVVYQTALAQLMAAPAVALLTWAGWQAARGPRTWRRLWGWSGLLLTGDWLLFGSYNFFILFAYIPVLAYVGTRTLRDRDWRGAGRWVVLVGTNLLVCAVLFPDRVVSVVERFTLFNQTAFGWPIPGFWPSGWYGAFGDAKTLLATNAKWFGVLAAAGLIAVAVAAFRQARRGRGKACWLAACCTVPILFGYWYLLREDRLQHDKASYDAFKLFTVFYPGILITLCLWLRGPFTAWRWRSGAAAGWAVLLLINVSTAWQFNAAVRKTPLLVDTDLSALSEIERMPQVDSVNVIADDVWDDLWVNYFLLHKRQYFTVPTYEGRAVTAARGHWTLGQRLVATRSGNEADLLPGNNTFELSPRQEDRFVDVRLDAGWYNPEHMRNDLTCWGGVSPTVRVDNPHPESLPASVSVSLHSFAGRHLRLCAGAQVLWEGAVGPTSISVDNLPLTLPPGATLIRFETPEPPDHAPGDARLLTFRLHRFQIDVQPAHPPAAN